ncbi:hypothetical protein HL653_11850 [Sphingomonas sp. AP4-R1]|uniref:hypothetical protein n=1 Tax=Sphingomonas sp. AP4-R1 TaxID=2735134 RepID=UPI0014934EA0|nr:hypothetical protein [Sphingomonas sp. AP4-R1]QJU58373.1 hypothetical protein HL653_11850 [Sphingomonas sp. AP4-R1]
MGHQEREEWELALSDAYSLESREPADRAALVLPIPQSVWNTTPPRLTLSDAATFVQQPFLALLENGTSDRSFILAVASTAERSFFERMEAAGSLFFESAGGITSLTRRVNNLDAPTRHRMWALFDSDALRPNAPSGQSNQAVAACVAASVPHHRLQRRSIENYLPSGQLQTWANASGAGRQERLRKVRALGRLSGEQRAHWSMKGGFAGDENRQGDSAGALFVTVEAADRATLRTGFGDHVWEIFRDNLIGDNDLTADNSIAELQVVIIVSGFAHDVLR